mmetsp:Transcript_18077/g.51756  ORF Transcript_18077/g.51756 Transcript_18077/m.51756 type:complete len:262 (-) Transcript_18077:294-1079(-)
MVLSTDAVVVGHHNVLRQCRKSRLDLVGRVAFHDGFQSHARGLVQKVLQGRTEHGRNEEDAIGTGLLGQSQLDLVDHHVLHNDGSGGTGLPHRADGALQLRQVPAVGLVVDVDEDGVGAQADHGIGDHPGIVEPRELLAGPAERSALDVDDEAAPAHGGIGHADVQQLGGPLLLLGRLGTGVGVGRILGILVHPPEGLGQLHVPAADALDGVAQGHPDGIGGAEMLGVQFLHLVFLAMDGTVDIFRWWAHGHGELGGGRCC